MRKRASIKKKREENVLELLAIPTPAETLAPRETFTVQETAQMLGISEVSIYRLIARKKIAVVEVLRHKLIPRTAIRDFLEKNVSKAA